MSDKKPAGYNPMRWDCEERGCFNVLRRPKIEVFADLFPRNIGFGDVDAIVELNGHGLMLEWKTDTKEAKRGQDIMYRRMTGNAPITVFLLVGNAETMHITHWGKYHMGKFYPLEASSLVHTREMIAKWIEWAESTPASSIRQIKQKVRELMMVTGVRK